MAFKVIHFVQDLNYVIIEASSLREWEFCFVVVHHVHFCGFSFVFSDFG
jgi:hypothetical protein